MKNLADTNGVPLENDSFTAFAKIQQDVILARRQKSIWHQFQRKFHLRRYRDRVLSHNHRQRQFDLHYAEPHA